MEIGDNAGPVSRKRKGSHLSDPEYIEAALSPMYQVREVETSLSAVEHHKVSDRSDGDEIMSDAKTEGGPP